MPNFEDVITAQTQDVAASIADVFFENSEYDAESDTRQVSDEGLKIMTEMFDDIQDTYRAEVFIELVAELDRRGVRFDPEQFQTGSVH